MGEDALDEGRARGNREQLGQVVAQAVADRDSPIRALDPNVDVEPEGVVAPDDVAEQLVVSPVVRRVDDSLLLPGAPRMSPDGGERDPQAAGELLELCAPLPDFRGGLREAFAPARSNLDLGGDQLADKVLLERRSSSRRLQLFEPVRERQRLRVEDRELLLDEIGRASCRERV